MLIKEIKKRRISFGTLDSIHVLKKNGEECVDNPLILFVISNRISTCYEFKNDR